jgi:hypothetical protein
MAKYDRVGGGNVKYNVYKKRPLPIGKIVGGIIAAILILLLLSAG